MARHCDQCEVLFINGVKCHEHGCPSAYKDEIRECKDCGCDFEPESSRQTFCNDCLNPPVFDDDDIDPEDDFEFDQLEEDERHYQQELSRQLQKFR